MEQSENIADEVLNLRRALRDLVALSTLPAVWAGGVPDAVGQSLADVLVETLSLDLIYIRFRGKTGAHGVEVARSPHKGDSSLHPSAVGKLLEPYLDADGSMLTPCVLNPFGDGRLRIAVVRLGHTGQHGVLIAGSLRPDFPTETERLLLCVAVNQATVVLQRNQAEEQQRRSERELADFFEHATLALHWVGPDGIILRVNRAELNLLGYSREEYVGHHIAEFHADADAIGDILRRLAAGTELQDYEARLRCKDGSIRDVIINSNVLWEDGKFVHTRCFTRDVTDHKRAEEALHQSREALTEANHRKDEFLATLSHELRNPLAPICNSLQVMKRAGQNVTLQEQCRSTIDRQVSQLVRLVDDLLDISRITSNKLELRKERTELAVVVASAVETSRPLIDAMSHELIVKLPSTPVHLHADVTRLAQVFANLLNNAAKYSDGGSRISLHAAREGNVLVVKVKDTGIGISADVLHDIFVMFTQADHSLNRSQGGLGIGLTLVKRLVEMHGGTVGAQSEGAGKGSEFTVRLPVADEASIERGHGSVNGSEPSVTARRILVVDDNMDSVDSLGTLLRLDGHDVHTAHDGEQALTAAAALRPDVVLLDIGLPKMNGYEVAHRIREQRWSKETLLVALTGWAQEEDRKRSRDAGFDHHFAKPVDIAALTTLIAATR